MLSGVDLKIASVDPVMSSVRVKWQHINNGDW